MFKKYFGKINNKAEAKQLVEEGVKGFYVLGGIQLGLGLVLGFTSNDFSTVFDGVLLLILAFLLKRFLDKNVASKGMSIFLLLLTIAFVVVTFGNRFGGNYGGGNNVILAIIALIIGIITVRGVFAYHSYS